MKIGLYFGSFNPIHIGHLIIADHVALNTACQQVWLVVSPQNPLKNASGLLNEYNRLYLASLAIEGNNRLKVSDIEFKMPKPSYTIDTLTYLQEKYPENTFQIIVGSDSLENLPKWKNFTELIKNYEFLVYERPGHPIVNNNGANIIVVKAPMLQISSTQIRNSIKLGKPIRYLVTEKVENELLISGYYK